MGIAVMALPSAPVKQTAKLTGRDWQSKIYGRTIEIGSFATVADLQDYLVRAQNWRFSAPLSANAVISGKRGQSAVFGGGRELIL